jgi:hypothetical protein
MTWQPIRTAPSNTRVLVCDDKGNVFIARASTLRWRDEADRLVDRPLWWQPLPQAPVNEFKTSQSTKRRKGRS